MAPAETRGQARTEAPTAHRLRAAQAQGQIAHSRTLTAAVSLLFAAAIIGRGAPYAWTDLALLTRRLWDVASIRRPAGFIEGGERAVGLMARFLGWPLVGAALGALLAGLVQTGGHVRWGAAAPDAGRLFGGGRRRAGMGGVLGLILLAGALAWTLASTTGGWLSDLSRASQATPRALLVSLGFFSRRLTVSVVVVALCVGVGDWLWIRHRLRRELMMSKDEVRREMREVEGDARWKLERRRRASSTADGFARAPLASFGREDGDVVVSGGEILQAGECAALLRHRALLDRAPVLVAKARGQAAIWMTSRAKDLGLPVRRNSPLARALMFVPEGGPIPDGLLDSVATTFPDSWPSAPATKPST